MGTYVKTAVGKQAHRNVAKNSRIFYFDEQI